jgi:hypothetical protein
MENDLKDFKVLEWLRKVRDDNYERLKHLDTAEFIRTLSEEGENSELAKRLNEKAAKRKNR